MEQAGGPRTARGWGTGAALAAELLQGVDSYVEVDVFAATAITHQLLLIKGLTERKGSDKNTSTPPPPHPPPPCRLLALRTIWKAASSDGQNLTHSSIKVLR